MNFKHLHYFWTVARTGGVAAAAQRLHVTPQTISGQVRLLEESLGVALFQPAGRGVVLTEAGRVALGYADEIFALGDELKRSVSRQRESRALPFRVGISDAVPKAIAWRLLAPASQLPEPVRLICREGKLNDLLGELALHRLDVIIADRPLPAGLSVRGSNHKLGESGLAFFAAPALAATLGTFPACLDGAPLLLPGDDAALRGRIEHWLETEHLAPRIAGEFDDSALMKAFGQEGAGIFPAATVIAAETRAQYGVVEIGQVPQVRETFYAITGERQEEHPASRAVTEAAHQTLAG